jgi:mono/diheme cytochrome c family protein
VQHQLLLRSWLVSLLAAIVLCGCTQEARDIGASAPQTPPRSAEDPRVAYYQSNVYQVSQGGRYFSWYGCGACHAEGAPGFRNLSDGRWRSGGGFDRVYRPIAQRHGDLRFGARVPAEQLWQITAYVRDLPLHTPEKRRRLAIDQTSEAQANDWTGPIR